MNDGPAPSFGQIAPWLTLALISFTVFWCLVPLAIARMSGWAALAAAYPAGQVMTPNMRWSWQSAVMNLNTSYNAGLTLVADLQAVHVSVFLLMRPGHKPFSVPWEDIRATPRHLLLMERVALTFAKAPNVTMLISPKLAERLAQASMGRLAVAGAQ